MPLSEFSLQLLYVLMVNSTHHRHLIILNQVNTSGSFLILCLLLCNCKQILFSQSDIVTQILAIRCHVLEPVE